MTLSASLLQQVLYESTFGPIALATVVGGLVLFAAGRVVAASTGVVVRKRVHAHVERVAPSAAGGARASVRAGFDSATAAAERALSHLRAWKSVERLLGRAHLELRTVDFLALAAGLGLGLAIVLALLGGSPFIAVLALVLGGSTPFAYAILRAGRRTRAFDEQLPEVLLTLSASLKVGHGFSQALRAVAEEGQAPASEEFARVLAEVRLGKPVEAALADLSARVRSENLAFVLAAVTIQREIGGSLAALLETVAETVRERQQFVRKVRGLTSMGRASAAVLIGLPFAAALGLTAVNGEYMAPLYTTGTGRVLIVVALGMMTVGSLFVRKIVSVRS